jgi:hypothetical protein
VFSIYFMSINLNCNVYLILKRVKQTQRFLLLEYVLDQIESCIASSYVVYLLTEYTSFNNENDIQKLCLIVGNYMYYTFTVGCLVSFLSIRNIFAVFFILCFIGVVLFIRIVVALLFPVIGSE